MYRKWLVTGALAALVAVITGAMATHYLKERLGLPPERIQIFETGARYQMYHAFGIIAVALFAGFASHKKGLHAAAWCFTAGILLFSGSLYILGPLTGETLTHWRWLGAITPFGGLSFIAGWALLAWSAWKQKTNT